jgi:hypothetical protein
LYKQNQLQAQRALVQTRSAERQKTLTKLRSLVHAKRQQMLVWKQEQEQVIVAHQEVPEDVAALWAWNPEQLAPGPLETTALVEAWMDYDDFTASYQHAQARRWAAWIRADAAHWTSATETVQAVVERLAVIADGYQNQNRSAANNPGDAADAAIQSLPRSGATTPPPFPPSPIIRANDNDGTSTPLPEAAAGERL